MSGLHAGAPRHAIHRRLKLIDRGTLIINSRTLANALKIKVHSLNYNSHTHGFSGQRVLSGSQLHGTSTRTHVCRIFTTTSVEQDAQITGGFDIKKIARVAEMLWVESEMMGRDKEHNGEQQSGIDSPFLLRTSTDPESEEMYSFVCRSLKLCFIKSPFELMMVLSLPEQAYQLYSNFYHSNFRSRSHQSDCRSNPLLSCHETV
jgi:hypothetical protein